LLSTRTFINPLHHSLESLLNIWFSLDHSQHNELQYALANRIALKFQSRGWYPSNSSWQTIAEQGQIDFASFPQLLLFSSKTFKRLTRKILKPHLQAKHPLPAINSNGEAPSWSQSEQYSALAPMENQDFSNLIPAPAARRMATPCNNQHH
jgi:hypothetical protein